MKYPETARRLTEAMAEKKMTAQELSNKSGVGKSSISHYVNGSNRPTNVNAGQMSEVLGVNPLWLMGFDEPMHLLTEHYNYHVAHENAEIHALIEATELRGRQMQHLFGCIQQMNTEGLNKLMDRAEEIIEIPKYRKDNGQPKPVPNAAMS